MAWIEGLSIGLEFGGLKLLAAHAFSLEMILLLDFLGGREVAAFRRYRRVDV